MDVVIDLTALPSESSGDWTDYSECQEDDYEESSQQLSESGSESVEPSIVYREITEYAAPVPLRRSPRFPNPFPHNPLAKPEPIPKLSEPTNECVVCFISRKSRSFRGFWPCRHVVVCSECSKQLDLCPMCRRPIDRTELYVEPE
jgi:hypothetical protein